MRNKIILRTSLFILFSLAFTEICVSFWMTIQSYLEENRFTPFYQLSTVDRQGRPISKKRGPLKLMLDPFLDFVLFPTQTTDHFTISNGFRNASTGDTAARPTKMVILGGSTAFGTGLNSDSDTLAARLEAALPSTKVINAAVPGYSSKHEAASMFWHAGNFKGAKSYILLNGFNDSTLALCDGTTEPSHLPIDELRAYLSMSDVNVLSRSVWGTGRFLLAATIDLASEKESCAFNLSPQLFEEAASKYIMHQKQIREIASKDGASVLCFLQPNLYSLFENEKIKLGAKPGERERFSTAYNLFRARVSDSLKHEAFSCSDFNNMPTNFAPEMFLDPIHLNAAGNDVMAKLIMEQMGR